MLKRIRNTLKHMPFLESFLKTDTWASIRYKLLLHTTKRVNSSCTAFQRAPMQLEALIGPVLDMLLSKDKKKKIRFIIAGCSYGSEPFTVASVLKASRPDLNFDMHCFDIEEDVINMAREGIFRERHIFNHQGMTDEFINSIFDKVDDTYKIKEAIARHAVFEIDDALDPTLKERIGQADILFAQHFLYHLPPKTSRKALENLCTLLKPQSALFIDGVDLSIRQSVTESQGLMPLDYKIEEIHNDLRAVSISCTDYNNTRGTAWPWVYWGLEPLSKKTKDWKRRYATVFMRDKTN